MASKAKKQEMERQSTRQFLGITGCTDYCLETKHGDLVFFIIKPTNISTMSEASIKARIYALMTVLKGLPELEMYSTNSRENYTDNKAHLQERLEVEDIPAIRKLLEQDQKFLDMIQVTMATARDFLIIIRLRNTKESEIFPYLSRIEKSLKDQGFTASRANKADIYKLLAVYHEQNVTTESFEDFDFDGERWIILGD